MRPLLGSILTFEDGSLAIAFSVAPPGKAYRPSLSGTAQRK